MAKTKTILVVEDEAAIRNMYETSLKNDGYEVLIAPDGETGLQLAQEKKPDVILLDIMMPKIDGWTVLQDLKEDDATKDIPVVMLTNLSQDEDKSRGEEYGAADYWVKAELTPLQVNEKLKEIIK